MKHKSNKFVWEWRCPLPYNFQKNITTMDEMYLDILRIVEEVTGVSAAEILFLTDGG